MSSHTTTYIALLRGINVGGHNVKMDKLRELFNKLKLSKVRSYIQSGNIFFDTSETDSISLQQKIEQHLQSSLGYSVPVCLRTIEQLESILSIDPFSDIPLTPDIRFSISFLSAPIDVKLSTPQSTPDGAYELIYMTSTELFVVWHLKNGRPGNSYGYLERQVKVPATTRFWHTTSKILAAAKNSQ